MMNKSADARAMARAWLISFILQVRSEDLKIQEKSHDSRFFCVLRFPCFDVPVSQPEDIVWLLLKQHIDYMIKLNTT